MTDNKEMARATLDRALLYHGDYAAQERVITEALDLKDKNAKPPSLTAFRTHTYTFAVMAVPKAFWDLVREKLQEAGYDHVLVETSEHGTVLDMNGIALGMEKPDAQEHDCPRCGRAYE